MSTRKVRCASSRLHRKELIDRKITEHRGRIVKTTGDGMLVEFVSVVDAVRCAVDVQRSMAERNSNEPVSSRNCGTDGNSLRPIPNTKLVYTTASVTFGPPSFPALLALVNGASVTFFCYQTSMYSTSYFFVS